MWNCGDGLQSICYVVCFIIICFFDIPIEVIYFTFSRYYRRGGNAKAVTAASSVQKWVEKNWYYSRLTFFFLKILHYNFFLCNLYLTIIIKYILYFIIIST